MSKKKLKLFVWHDSLTDHTEGVMFAFAYDADHARQLILAKCSYVPKEDLAREPSVYDTPVGFDVWGGG